MHNAIHVFWASLFLFAQTCFAQESLQETVRLVVTDPAPFVFSPNSFYEEDFEIVLVSEKLQARFIPKSFEWVRINRSSIYPRARVQVSFKDKALQAPLMIQYAGMTSINEVLLALITTGEARIFDKDGLTELGKMKIRFNPKRNLRNKVVVDSTCSPYGVEVVSQKLQKSWLELGCKLVKTESRNGSRPYLEMMVYWDGAKLSEPLMMDSQVITRDESPLHMLKLTSDQPKITLKRGDEEVIIKHTVPPIYNHFHLSIGLGPYLYQIKEPGLAFSKWVPFGTLYAAYLVNESLKLASFWAFPVDSKFQTDVGFYLITEQFRGVDERLSLNLLLGAHALLYKGKDKNHFSFSAPQGVELVVRDCFAKRKNLSLGGFFYPNISGRSYINSWMRWGSGSLFYELNYISWIEPFDGYATSSKSLGLSVGFPLFRAF